MSILEVKEEFLPPDTVAEGAATRGVYLSNLWYGQQQILLRYAGLPAGSYLPAKMQIGWQTGKNMGLDGEQGFKEVVKIHRLPFLLWNSERLKLAEAQGMLWGHAIGAAFLYMNAAAYSDEKIKSAIMFPSHSIPDYEIKSGWKELADDFVGWARSMGLGATICLHPNDYANGHIRGTLADYTVTCCGSLFYEGYLQRFADLISAHEIAVVNKASSPMFYAASRGVPVYCRGKLTRTEPVHPDEPAVDCDLSWIKAKFPWALDGSDGADSALTELGIECMLTSDGIRELLALVTEMDTR